MRTQCCQASQDKVLTTAAAVDGWQQPVISEAKCCVTIGMIGVNDGENQVDLTSAEHGLDGVAQHRSAREVAILLRHATTDALAGASRDDDRGYCLASRHTHAYPAVDALS